MDIITVNGSTSYNVIIECGILGRVGELVANEVGGVKALIVTDLNVTPLYLNTLAQSLSDAGYRIVSHELEPGDSSKSIENYVELLTILTNNDFSSTDVIVALGGGMVGDITGFVGSTYKRGMKVVQIPTSLLAAVDASVGGKTAINLPSGKNQVGTFYNPSIVICDPNTVSTLSIEELHVGMAEIIKYGILSGDEILAELRKAVQSSDYSKVIAMSVALKRDVVEADEHDNNLRQYLNLGHLIGHAIEAYSGYAISHGQAVAEGLVLEARCAAMSGFTEMSTYTDISVLFKEFGFDISRTYSLENLYPYLLHDKRIRDSKIGLIVPLTIGSCTTHSIDAGDIKSFLQAGL